MGEQRDEEGGADDRDHAGDVAPPAPKGFLARQVSKITRGGPLGLLAPAPAIVAILIFYNTLFNGFVYDDLWKVQAVPGTLPAMEELYNLRSVPYVTQVMDRWLWGTWAPGFHWTNVLLHALASTLAAYAALALSGSRPIGVWTGLFFAIHPVHVEAVASFANRKDILAMMSVALALILWRNPKFPNLSYAGAVACLCLGFFTKEIAVVGVVPMLFLADLLLPADGVPRHARLRTATLRILPFLMAALGLGLRFAGKLPLLFTPGWIRRVTENQLDGYGQVLANTAAAIPDQLRLLLWPVRLSADYPPDAELSLTHPKALLGVGLILAWGAASLLVTRRARLAGFALIWPVVTLLPCSNLVPLTKFFIAERYLYVPSFGVCLLAAWAIARWTREERPARQRAAAAGIAIAVLVLGSARCVARNRDWRDAESLWTAAREAGYDTWRAHNNLAFVRSQQGDWEGAIEHLERSLEIQPGTAHVLKNLAQSYVEAGRLREAGVTCRRVLQISDDDVVCYYTLGRIAAGRGDRERAAGYLQRALDLDPNTIGALELMSRLRAVAPEAHLRDGSEALRLAERAQRLTKGANPAILWALAVAHESVGDLEQARQWSRRARYLAHSRGRNRLASDISLYLDRLLETGAGEASASPPSIPRSDGTMTGGAAAPEADS